MMSRKYLFNIVQHSDKYRDTEKLLNNTPGITNFIAHSSGGSVAQKIKDNYPDRNYKITTYGSPILSISKHTPINITPYKNIGDPIAMLDRGAQVIGSNLNPFEAHSFKNSPYTFGDTGKWVIGDASKINTPWNPENSAYTTPPILQTELKK